MSPLLAKPLDRTDAGRFDDDHVLARVDHLKQIHEAQRGTRRRIRNILDGGEAAVAELLGADAALEFKDIPLPNLMMRGMSTLAQKIGRAPTLKVPTVSRQSDSEAALENAELRQRIIEGYDDEQRLEMQLPQVARWALGYGFAVWMVRDHLSPEGYLYPIAELRDPFDCYPGYWGPTQRPQELAVIRQVPPEALAQQFPRFASAINPPARTSRGQRSWRGGVILGSQGRGWESNSSNEDGLEFAEYIDISGTYSVIPERGLVVDFVPNPLRQSVPFVIPRRFSFNQLAGHYDHLIGLMVAFVKMTILGVVAMEDGVFVETNVEGEVLSGEYRKGRGEVNIMAPGSSVSRPQNNLPYQLFQQIDRVERQLRIGSGYSVQDDSESPIDFATGRGIEALGLSMSNEVKEYQLTLTYAMQDLDRIRLEWDEESYGGLTKPVLGEVDGKSWTETYDPAVDIAGRWRTRRVYGVMAGWDEPSKLVTGIQLLGAEILDTLTIQENLDGLDDIPGVNKRIRKEKAEKALYRIIEAAAAQPQDPAAPPNPETMKARMALIELYKNPEDIEEILNKFYTPEDPQLNPEEEALLGQGQEDPLAALFGGGGGGPPGGAPGGAPPGVQTVLSRLELSGGAEGGSQTVQRI